MASSAFSGVVPRKGRLRRWLILGVGGFLVVIGLAFFLNSLFDSRGDEIDRGPIRPGAGPITPGSGSEPRRPE